jgi:hypothetical protein
VVIAEDILVVKRAVLVLLGVVEYLLGCVNGDEKNGRGMGRCAWFI